MTTLNHDICTKILNLSRLFSYLQIITLCTITELKLHQTKWGHFFSYFWRGFVENSILDLLVGTMGPSRSISESNWIIFRKAGNRLIRKALGYLIMRHNFGWSDSEVRLSGSEVPLVTVLADSASPKRSQYGTFYLKTYHHQMRDRLERSLPHFRCEDGNLFLKRRKGIYTNTYTYEQC